MTLQQGFWLAIGIFLVIAIAAGVDWFWSLQERRHEQAQNTFQQRREAAMNALHLDHRLDSKGPHGFDAQANRRAHASQLRSVK